MSTDPYEKVAEALSRYDIVSLAIKSLSRLTADLSDMLATDTNLKARNPELWGKIAKAHVALGVLSAGVGGAVINGAVEDKLRELQARAEGVKEAPPKTDFEALCANMQQDIYACIDRNNLPVRVGVRANLHTIIDQLNDLVPPK